MTCRRSPQLARTTAHRLLLGVVVALVLVWGSSCTSGGAHVGESPEDSRKMVIVLLDRSGSAQEDQGIYVRALNSIRSALRAGDRFVLGSITTSSGKDFAASVDYIFPDPVPEQGWLDEPVEHRRKVREHERKTRELQAEIAADIERFLAQESNARQTSIFESLRVIEPLVQSEDRRKVLVLLSDMVEDSDLVNFDRTKVSAEFTQKEIERQRQGGYLPDLKGVHVYAVGAISSPPERAAAIEFFWRVYFESTGAVMKAGHYARVLTSFPE